MTEKKSIHFRGMWGTGITLPVCLRCPDTYILAGKIDTNKILLLQGMAELYIENFVDGKADGALS